MKQAERREYLIRFLLDENPRYQNIAIPREESAQSGLLRSLLNVRPPKPVSSMFLAVQDAYLQEESRRKGIVYTRDLQAIQPKIYLWQGDITRLAADGIVNAANSALLGCFIPCHGCIDNAIHSAAGIQLRLACAELMQAQGAQEPTGSVKITPAYNLPSHYVLHTVGPIIQGALTLEDCELLAACYRACLALAMEKGLQSIAFCCISTGEFHFPNEKAAQIAVDTVRQFQADNIDAPEVIFNVFKDIDHDIYRKLLQGHSKA